MSKFATKLKDLRIAKSWSLREVEKRTGVSRQTVLRAESGKVISLDVLLKFCMAYNLSDSEKGKLMMLFVEAEVAHAKKRRSAVRAALRATTKPKKAQRVKRPSK